MWLIAMVNADIVLLPLRKLIHWSFMLFFLYDSFPYNSSPHQLQSEHVHNKSEVEDDDCSLGKVEARPCMNDIKGLSSLLVLNGHFHSCNSFKENWSFSSVLLYCFYGSTGFPSWVLQPLHLSFSCKNVADPASIFRWSGWGFTMFLQW